MKKTIGALAVLASVTSAYAFVGPDVPVVKPTKHCLRIDQDDQGQMHASDCDETKNNKELNRKLSANGCADGQAVFYSRSVKLPACWAPNIVQL